MRTRLTEAVEIAVLEAWRKNKGGSGWWHILGQIRPTREARVRVIFEALAKDDMSAPQLLDRALDRRILDPVAAALAADLAAEALPTAPNALVRSLLLRVLREQGTAEHLPALRAYAENPMIAEGVRQEAAKVVEAVSKRH